MIQTVERIFANNLAHRQLKLAVGVVDYSINVSIRGSTEVVGERVSFREALFWRATRSTHPSTLFFLHWIK